MRGRPRGHVSCINHKCKNECVCKLCSRRKRCGCDRDLNVRLRKDFCDHFKDWIMKITRKKNDGWIEIAR